MRNSESLYDSLGIENFASPFKVNEAIEKIRGTEQFDTSRVQLAMEVLTDNELKDAYNILLESRDSANNQLPHIRDDRFLQTVLELAERLEFKVQQKQHGSLILGAEPLQINATMATNSEDSNSFPVGRTSVNLFAAPFVASPIFFGSAIHLQYLDCRGDAQLVSSAAQLASSGTEPGDQGYVILAGIGQNEPDKEAAMINCSKSTVAPLSAGDDWFGRSGEDIAHQFRIRNSPARISRIIQEYYIGLAEFLARFDHNIGANSAKRSFLNFAKLRHRL